MKNRRAIAAAIAMNTLGFALSAAAADEPSAPPPANSAPGPAAPPAPGPSSTAAASPTATPSAPAAASPAATTPASGAQENAAGPPVSPRSESGSVTPMGGSVAEAKPATPKVPSWLDGVTLGAGALLWYYQPIVPRAAGVKNSVSVFWAHLLIDGKWGAFALHIEPRFRDTPLRTITVPVNGTPVVSYSQDDRAWLQEAYVSADLDPVGATLKVGKEYSQFGYFWDGSFYGNVQVYDGLKLDPDYGASLEGKAGTETDPIRLAWWVQYFVIDGQTNVSLAGRDTISVPGARRRNQTIARIEPTFGSGPVNVTLGISGEYVNADLPGIGPQDVLRGAADVKLSIDKLKVLAEIQHQAGRSVTDFPFASSSAGPGSSRNIDYGQVGGEYTYGPVTARYYVSTGWYHNAPMPGGGTATVKEWLHVAGLGVAVSPNVSLLGELVFWQHDTPAQSVLYDRSFNLTLFGHL